MLGDIPTDDPRLLVGVGTRDDAGVIRLDHATALVQTVDFFTPIVDDAADWGAVAAANALSDVYAMGGRPLSALTLVGWPRGVLPFELLGEVVRGGLEVMAEAGCVVVGGHSIDDPEPKFGYAITGVVAPDAILTNAGARAGDTLVLTKPLGTGILTTALKRDLLAPADLAPCVAWMRRLNRDAAEQALAAGAHAATDVTGYGLVGHLYEVAHASGVMAVLDSGAVPLMDRVLELAAAAVVPGGSARNLDAANRYTDWGTTPPPLRAALTDAQTSGGLLVAVPPEAAPLVEGSVVGRCEAGVPGHIRVI